MEWRVQYSMNHQIMANEKQIKAYMKMVEKINNGNV